VPENHKAMILPGDAATRDHAIELGYRREKGGKVDKVPIVVTKA
jgi:hypothetical protein